MDAKNKLIFEQIRVSSSWIPMRISQHAKSLRPLLVKIKNIFSLARQNKIQILLQYLRLQ